jgi:hypothetical protein
MTRKFLFVLSPPYSGSTVLQQLLGTSPATSSHPTEGQVIPGVQELVWDNRWNEDYQYPWATIREKWEQVWDMAKPILVEKSPPHIIRAFEIEKIFCPAYFIALIRDPYAFCEGARVRESWDIRTCAEFWVRCANSQRQNIQGLKHIIHFKYEEFADHPSRVKSRILSFLPELQDIDTQRAFDTRSVRGRGLQHIENFNRDKINRLSTNDINSINAVLSEHEELMSYYRYHYLHPSAAQTLRYLRSIGIRRALNAIKDPAKLRARLRSLMGL